MLPYLLYNDDGVQGASLAIMERKSLVWEAGRSYTIEMTIILSWQLLVLGCHIWHGF